MKSSLKRIGKRKKNSKEEKSPFHTSRVPIFSCFFHHFDRISATRTGIRKSASALMGTLLVGQKSPLSIWIFFLLTSHSFLFQYDPEGRKKRHLYYHFLDENKPDKLILRIRKADANAISFKVSGDYKYLILRSSQMLRIANISSMEREIRFEVLFKMSKDVIYVSKMPFKFALMEGMEIYFSFFKSGIRWK